MAISSTTLCGNFVATTTYRCETSWLNKYGQVLFFYFLQALSFSFQSSYLFLLSYSVCVQCPKIHITNARLSWGMIAIMWILKAMWQSRSQSLRYPCPAKREKEDLSEDLWVIAFELDQEGEVNTSALTDPMIIAIVTSRRKKRANAQNFRKWRRRVSLKQRFFHKGGNKNFHKQELKLNELIKTLSLLVA